MSDDPITMAARPFALLYGGVGMMLDTNFNYVVFPNRTPKKDKTRRKGKKKDDEKIEVVGTREVSPASVACRHNQTTNPSCFADRRPGIFPQRQFALFVMQSYSF